MIHSKQIFLLISLVIVYFFCVKNGTSISNPESIKMQFENRNIPFQEKTTFQVGGDSYEINYEPYRSGVRIEHYTVSILKNGKNITDQFIKGDYELAVKNPFRNTQLVSPDKKYFLVPMVYGTARLIRTKDLSHFKPLFQHREKHDYLGNIFYPNYLLSIHKKNVYINHLESGAGCGIHFQGNQEVIWAERNEEGNLFLKLKEGWKVSYKELLIPSLEFNNAPPRQAPSEVPVEISRVKHESTFHHTSIYKVNGHEYDITVLDLDEPNNGRMLERISFKIDGKDVTEKYLGKWNYFPMSTSGHKKISPDGNHLLLPHESGVVIVHTKDGDFVKFPRTGSKANSFKKLSSNASYFESSGYESYMLAHIENKIALTVHFYDGRFRGARISSEPFLELTSGDYKAPKYKVNLRTLELIRAED